MSFPSPERVSATPQLIERAKHFVSGAEMTLATPTDCWGNPDLGSSKWPSFEDLSKIAHAAPSLVSDLVQVLEESQGKLARVREWASVDDALGDTPSGYARKVAKRELRRLLDEGNPQ